MLWDPMWGISILADFRPMEVSFHAGVAFGLGKDFLFKSTLGHCGLLSASCFKPKFMGSIWGKT